jgi:hypothetical protein
VIGELGMKDAKGLLLGWARYEAERKTLHEQNV